VSPTAPLEGVAGTAARARRGRRLTGTALRAAVTAAAAVLLVRKASLGEIFSRFAHADARWLVLGYLLAAGSILLTVAQWYGLLAAAAMRRSYRRCLRLELAGDCFDAALPSSIGGDLLRATRVAERPDEKVSGASAVVLRRLCNFPGMVLLLGAGLLACSGLPYLHRVLPVALGALGGGSASIALSASPLFGRLARSPLCRRGPGRVLGKLFVALHDFRGKRRDLLVASLRGVAFWSVAIASQACFIEAMGIHVPLDYAAVVITTTTALTMLPISLGGYGLREGSFAAFLAVAGHATAAEGAAVGVCLTVQMVALGLFGIPFLVTLRRGARPEPVRAALAAAVASGEAA